MMDWNERLGWLVLGMLAGFVLGYIVRSLREIKEELDEVKDLEKEHIREHHDEELPERGEQGLTRKPVLLDIVLLLVVLLTAYAAFSSQKNSNDLEENYKADTIARCQSAVDSRNVQRSTVDAIYNLAIGFAAKSKGDPPRTPKEVVRTNRYIDQVNAFRQDLYDKIKPSAACEKYVHDDNVKPPTPPAPPVTN